MRPNSKSNPQWLASVIAGRAGACERNRERVIELAAAGLSLTKIGKAIGTKCRHVAAFLHRENIPYTHHNGARGKLHPGWKGGRQIDKNGYVIVNSYTHPNRRKSYRIFEHRLVMSQKIGRPLLPSEVVHHINGNKADNRPENLALFSKNSEHLRHELMGRVPKWTEDGQRRIQQGIARSLETRRLKTLRLRALRDGHLLPENFAHSQA